MVNNELSDALRKLEASFSNKIDYIASKRRSSTHSLQANTRPTLDAKDSTKVTSSTNSNEVTFVSWVFKKLFGK